MAKSFLLDPAAAVARLAARYRNQRKAWLAGVGEWPLSQTLGFPTQQEAMVHLSQVRAWRDAWADWKGPGQVRWLERRWPALGTQSLPEALILDSPAQAAELAGEGEHWQRAARRVEELASHWPALADEAPFRWELLAIWSDADYQRFKAVLTCLAEGDWRGHYIRQLPIPGIDSKWLETRQALLALWLAKLKGQPETSDLHALAGLSRPPQTLRLRLLDPALRAHFGGLRDVQAPPEDLAAAAPPVERVYIVENLQTGLAFTDLSGAAVFMQQGYAVDLFGRIPWLKTIPCHYWGDLDTHGFAILDRLRVHLPHARSLLMDEETLLRHREYWAHEVRPAARELPRLNEEEQVLYQHMLRGKFGVGVRLEQERVEWNYAWGKIREILNSG